MKLQFSGSERTGTMPFGCQKFLTCQYGKHHRGHHMVDQDGEHEVVVVHYPIGVVSGVDEEYSKHDTDDNVHCYPHMSESLRKIRQRFLGQERGPRLSTRLSVDFPPIRRDLFSNLHRRQGSRERLTESLFTLIQPLCKSVFNWFVVEVTCND